MTELRERFGEFRDVPAPDLWGHIEDLATTPPRLQRRRPRTLVVVVACVAAAVLIGGPLLFLRRPDAPVVDAAFPWGAVPAEAPAHDQIVDAVAMPGGGFVVISETPVGVVWSPDGVDWYDIDPDGDLASYEPGTAEGLETQDLAAVDDRVVVLDRGGSGIWVGDSVTGTWESIALDADAPVIELHAVAAAGREVLVVGATGRWETVEYDEGEMTVAAVDEYVGWNFEIGAADLERVVLPQPGTGPNDHTEAAVTRFGDHWLVVIATSRFEGLEGWDGTTALLSSPDGGTWSASDPPEEWGDVTSVSAGPERLIATTCHFGGDSLWSSRDAEEWVRVAGPPARHRSAYVDGLGFVVGYDGESVDGNQQTLSLSVDGVEWQSPASSGVTIARYPDDVAGRQVDVTPILLDNRLWAWWRGSGGR